MSGVTGGALQPEPISRERKPSSIHWVEPLRVHAAKAFNEARELGLWGWRACLRWLIIGAILAGLFYVTLQIFAPGVLPQVSMLRMLMIAPISALIPALVTLQLVGQAEHIRIEPGSVRFGGAKRIEGDRLHEVVLDLADPNRRVLMVTYADKRGRRRVREIGLAASVDTRQVQAVFERDGRRGLVVISNAGSLALETCTSGGSHRMPNA